MVKDPNCRNKNWRTDILDEMIFDEIRKIASDPSFFETMRKERDKKNDTANKIEVLEKEIAKIDEQISRFMDLYGLGKFTIDQVSAKIDPLNEKRSHLENELNELAINNTMTEEETIEIVKTFEEALERADLDQCRLLIQSLISRIELDGEDVYIHWRFA